MGTILRILISALIVYFIAWLLPGISIDGYTSAILVAILISVVNTAIKPVIEMITFPLTILTFGIWLLVVNIFLIKFIDYLLPGFHVNSYLWALVFAILVSIFGASINIFGSDNKH